MTSHAGQESTAVSVVMRLSSDEEPDRARAFDHVSRVYWQPAFEYVRRKWQADEHTARDLVQSFFCQALEKRSLANYNPSRGRFRSFLKMSLDSFVANDRRAAQQIKRGGNKPTTPLESADVEFGRWNRECNDAFHQEWIKSLVAGSLANLQGELHAANLASDWQLFERYDLHDDPAEPRPTHQQLAVDFTMTVTQIANRLSRVRGRLRAAILRELRHVTCSEEEARSEARVLLGQDPP